jgi:hypothetical protein
MEALEAGTSLAAVHARLAALEAALSTALQDSMAVLSPSTALFLQAAVYDLYELLLFCEQLGSEDLGESQPQAAHLALARLGRCLAIASCVARGSELQVHACCVVL